MCLVLVALLAGFAGLIRSNDRAAHRMLADRFETRAVLTATFTKSFVDDIAARERSQAARLLGDPTVDQATFESVVQAFDFEAAVLLDGDGHLLQVWPAKPGLIGRDMTIDYPHLRAAVAGRVGVSEIVPSAARRMPITAVAVPFDTPSGRRVFSGAFSPTATPLGLYLRSVVPVRGATAFLVDRSGHVIAGESESEGASATARDVADLQPGINEFDGEQARLITAVVDVRDSPWRVVLASPSAALYAPLETTKFSPWWLWLAFCLAGCLAIVLFVGLGRSRAQAAASARTDVLTGLVNRRAMEEALVREAATATRHQVPLTALMVDIDHFKEINDTYGHDVGDDAIRGIGSILVAALRDGDIGARWGGEEFMILLPHTDRVAAVAVAERVRSQVVAQSRDVASAMTVSIGIAELAEDVHRMVRDADAALYLAKARGRDRVEVCAPTGAEGEHPSPPVLTFI